MIIKALYSIPEVAEMIDVPVSTVRRMVSRGHLDAIRIGRLVFVPLSSLQARAAMWESIQLKSEYDPD